MEEEEGEGEGGGAGKARGEKEEAREGMSDGKKRELGGKHSSRQVLDHTHTTQYDPNLKGTPSLSYYILSFLFHKDGRRSCDGIRAISRGGFVQSSSTTI